MGFFKLRCVKRGAVPLFARAARAAPSHVPQRAAQLGAKSVMIWCPNACMSKNVPDSNENRRK